MNFKRTKIACYIGFTVQAIINNFLPILFIVFQKNYGLGYEKLGNIVLINFSVQMISDLLTPLITSLIGYKKTVLLCHFLSALGLLLLGILPFVMKNIYIALMISVAVYAFGSGIIEVILSPLVNILPSKNNAASMAFTHSFYCWGQALTVVLTTVFVILFGYNNWCFIPIVWALVPIFNIFFFAGAPIIEPQKKKALKSNSELFKTKEFYCFAIFMICAGVSEITMSEWTSFVAQSSLGVSKVIGDLAGPCAFALFMGAGRIIFGLLSGRFSVKNVLIINNILCFLCYFAVGISRSAFISLFACALCGFTVSLSWPGTYSLAAKRFPHGGTLMFSLYALSGDIGCSLGPWIFGIAAERISVSSGFIICSVFPLITVLTALFGLNKKDCKQIENNV